MEGANSLSSSLCFLNSCSHPPPQCRRASPSAPGERTPARTPERVTPFQDPVRKRGARAEFWGIPRAKIKFLRRQVKI